LRAITPPPPPQPSSGPLAAPAATYARRSSSPRWPKCLHPTRRHGLSTPRPESMPWPEHAMYWGGSQDVAPDATRRLWRWRMARCGTPPRRARSPPHHASPPRLTTPHHGASPLHHLRLAVASPAASPRLDLARSLTTTRSGTPLHHAAPPRRSPRRSTTPLHHAAPPRRAPEVDVCNPTCAIPRVQSHSSRRQRRCCDHSLDGAIGVGVACEAARVISVGIRGC